LNGLPIGEWIADRRVPIGVPIGECRLECRLASASHQSSIVNRQSQSPVGTPNLQSAIGNPFNLQSAVGNRLLPPSAWVGLGVIATSEAVDGLAMYVFVRQWMWRGAWRPIAL
jgi:hypothetical protein